MQLPNFFSKLKKQHEKQEHIFALLITADYVGAVLWIVKGEKVDIIGKSTIPYRGGWDQIITASDQALSQSAEGIAQDITVDRVLFGLQPGQVEGDKIKPDIVTELKKLCKQLSLTPAGFVVIPEAIAYFLGKEDGIPPTIILIGVEKSSITLTLFKVGKTIGMVSAPRSDSIANDVEEALSGFKDIEVMPSKILLYDGEKTLGKLRDDLLKYPWQSKSAFLHFPKIEVLPQDTTLIALSVAGASELEKQKGLEAVIDEETGEVETLAAASHTVPEESMSTSTGDEKKEEEKKEELLLNEPVDEEEVTIMPEKEIEETEAAFPSASTMGFTTDAEKVEEKPITHQHHRRPMMEVVVEEEERKEEPKGLPSVHMPEISMPRISFSIFKTSKLAVIIVLVALFLFGGVAVSLYWTYPKAQVAILVDPQIVKSAFDIKFDPTATSLDSNTNTIPAKTIDIDISGKKSTGASGNKNVGDPARGDVTIYNKTTTEKVFPKGSVLAGPKGLKFTLDESVSVASISDVIVGTPGKASAKVSASQVGADSNIPAGSDFSFKDLPVTSYAGRNERAFAGGTSKEVQAIAKSDYEELQSMVTEEVTNNARTQIQQQLSKGEQLLDQSIVMKTTKKTYSGDIGDEAREVSIDVTMHISALAYSYDDLLTLSRDKLKSTSPGDATLTDKDISIQVVKMKTLDSGIVQASIDAKGKLLPSIPTDDIRKNLLGKNTLDSEKYLKTVKGVVGYEVSFTQNVPYMPQTLPHVLSNLTIRVESR